jgi:hypothetical protein
LEAFMQISAGINAVQARETHSFGAAAPRRLAVRVALALSLGLSTAAAADYNEASLPGQDFSDLAGSPTELVFTPGSNRVTGTVVTGTDVPDFITFTINPGQRLSAIRIVNYSPDNRGFHALTTGSVSFDPSDPSQVPSGASFSGSHIQSEADGTDLLPTFAVPGAAGGGIASFGPRTYSYVIQQTGSPQVSYTLDFVVSAPAPALPVWGSVFLSGLVATAGLFASTRLCRPRVA